MYCYNCSVNCKTLPAELAEVIVVICSKPQPSDSLDIYLMKLCCYLDLRSDFVPRGFNVNLKLFLNTYIVLHSFCIKIL